MYIYIFIYIYISTSIYYVYIIIILYISVNKIIDDHNHSISMIIYVQTATKRRQPACLNTSPVHLASAASCEDPAGNAVATEAKAAWDFFPQTIVEVEKNMILDSMEKDFLGCSQFPFFPWFWSKGYRILDYKIISQNTKRGGGRAPVQFP